MRPRLRRRRPSLLRLSTQVITLTDPVSSDWRQPGRTDHVALLRKTTSGFLTALWSHWWRPETAKSRLKLLLCWFSNEFVWHLNMTGHQQKIVLPPFLLQLYFTNMVLIQCKSRLPSFPVRIFAYSVLIQSSCFWLFLLSFKLGYFSISFPVMQPLKND